MISPKRRPLAPVAEPAPVAPPLFFPRGPGPLVSVLLPTRKRPDWLKESVASLIDKAVEPSRVEFIIKVDDDDPESFDVATQLMQRHRDQNGGSIQTISTPRGGAYLDMHLWATEMAKLATGDWLYLWNDDARMTVNQWDHILLFASIHQTATWHGCPDICALLTHSIELPWATEFMFLRRKVFELLGHYSLSPHNDTYVYRMLSFISSEL